VFELFEGDASARAFLADASTGTFLAGASARAVRASAGIGWCSRSDFGSAASTAGEFMSGAGAGVFVKVFFALWYCGSGRPVRWLVTIAGELVFSSLASTTNSSAVRTKPAIARSVRAGIAVFLRVPSAFFQKAKSGHHAASSYGAVRTVQMILTSDRYARYPIIQLNVVHKADFRAHVGF